MTMTSSFELPGTHRLKIQFLNVRSACRELNGKRTGSLADTAAFYFCPERKCGANGEDGTVAS